MTHCFHIAAYYKLLHERQFVNEDGTTRHGPNHAFFLKKYRSLWLYAGGERYW